MRFWLLGQVTLKTSNLVFILALNSFSMLLKIVYFNLMFLFGLVDLLQVHLFKLFCQALMCWYQLVQGLFFLSNELLTETFKLFGVTGAHFCKLLRLSAAKSRDLILVHHFSFLNLLLVMCLNLFDFNFYILQFYFVNYLQIYYFCFRFNFVLDTPI